LPSLDCHHLVAIMLAQLVGLFVCKVAMNPSMRVEPNSGQLV
jgi:hypothetical protein